jgi:Barstar (barnase inhibitor)
MGRTEGPSRDGRVDPVHQRSHTTLVVVECHFGENWNAFDECLADLEWLPSDAHILIISNAVHVLEDEPPGSFVDFLELVERVARERSEARPDDAGGQGPKPFHVVLHTEPTDGPALERKLEAAGVPYDLLH